MPCPGPFHFSHTVYYIYDLCPLPDPDAHKPINQFPDYRLAALNVKKCA